MISPAEFMSQVKRELHRVAWPTQKETFGMTAAVILMVVCAMAYFFISDSVIYFCLRKILGV
ncbi:MAG: preprotein translocase subunit SecE [Holosporaceae bacterium]|jgi:preprotein translocase subunit SecE|nr:preprotein translocase subunit SecE [Holosporaceae bacterium]